MKYFTKNADETIGIAAALSLQLKGGEVLLLNGDLGAGKTTFTKGLVKGLGSDEMVSSPTFTLLHIYEGGRLPVYHFDMYRIESADELYELGFDDYLFGDGVCVIEWNKLENLPDKLIEINFESEGGNSREIEICGF